MPSGFAGQHGDGEVTLVVERIKDAEEADARLSRLLDEGDHQVVG